MEIEDIFSKFSLKVDLNNYKIVSRNNKSQHPIPESKMAVGGGKDKGPVMKLGTKPTPPLRIIDSKTK